MSIVFRLPLSSAQCVHVCYLLQPGEVVVQPALLQEGPELTGDVEPHPCIVSHVPHKRKRLIGLQRGSSHDVIDGGSDLGCHTHALSWTCFSCSLNAPVAILSLSLLWDG